MLQVHAYSSTKMLAKRFHSETISAESAGNVWYDSIAADQTYYVSFTAKSTDTFYFNYKGSEGRLVIKTNGYGLLGVADADNNQLWGSINTGLNGADGVKVTLCSESTKTTLWMKTTLWINGEKVEENISLTTSAAEKAGKPQVSWAVADTTMSDIKVWTAKDGAEEPPVSDEPVYNAETDTLKYMSTSEIVSAGTAGQSWGVTIPGDTTYFGTFKVVTTGSIWFRYRGTADDTAGRMLLDQKQCGFYGLVQNMWPQGDRGLSDDGIKVTFRSEPDKTTIWINGEKLADDAAMATTGQVGVPWVTWAATADATITDIAFWKTKDANDEPVYDETKDKQYNITSVAEGCTYADGELKVPAQKGAGVTTELPSNAAYYMTMRVKTDNYVNIGTRVGSLIHIEKVGYSFDGTTENTWVSDQKLFAKLATGVKITIYSDTVGFKIWVDGEKAIERTYSTANSSTNPDIPWSFASEVTASDIQIWTLNVAEPAGHNITLDGNIGVNFYMNLGAAINPEEAVMNFTLPDGSTQQVTGVSTDKGYQYTCEVAAKEMTKEIKAQVVAGDAVSKEYTYSVKDYADSILNDEATYGKAIPLVKAMLNYGAYAQTYFGYNTEALANDGLVDTDVSGVTETDLERFAKSAPSNEFAGLAGASLILESETTLKLYFTLPAGADVSLYTFSNGSEDLKPVKSGIYYYVTIQDIDAKNLDTDYKVTVKYGENSLEVTYSPMTYCYNVLKGYTGDKAEELKNVVRALYLYNSKANAYFSA